MTFECPHSHLVGSACAGVRLLLRLGWILAEGALAEGAFAKPGAAHYVFRMRSLLLRRLIGLLALLVFALALPLQASMGASMTSCAAPHVAMDMDHGDAKSDCGKSGAPLKAAMGAVCASAICATVATLPAQAEAPLVHDHVAQAYPSTQLRAGLLTAPDPFPPRPTVRA